MTEPDSNSPAEMTVSSLRALLREMAEANRRSLAERDLRFQQRFDAQAEAIATARKSAEDATAMAASTFVVKESMATCLARVDGLDRLTDAKFVTFRTLIDSQAEKVALALSASEKAIAKAEASTQKAIDKTADDIKTRFDSVNEFRGQLSDQAATFIPRKEAEQRIDSVLERVETLRQAVNTDDQKLDERLKVLERGSSNLQGRLWALGTAIAAVVVIVNIVIAVFLK